LSLFEIRRTPGDRPMRWKFRFRYTRRRISSQRFRCQYYNNRRWYNDTRSIVQCTVLYGYGNREYLEFRIWATSDRLVGAAGFLHTDPNLRCPAMSADITKRASYRKNTLYLSAIRLTRHTRTYIITTFYIRHRTIVYIYIYNIILYKGHR